MEREHEAKRVEFDKQQDIENRRQGAAVKLGQTTKAVEGMILHKEHGLMEMIVHKWMGVLDMTKKNLAQKDQNASRLIRQIADANTALTTECFTSWADDFNKIKAANVQKEARLRFVQRSISSGE